MEEVKKLHDDGLYSDDIAALLKIDRLIIDLFLINTYYNYSKTKLSMLLMVNAINLRYLGIPFVKIAQQYGVSDSYFVQHLKRCGIKFRNCHYKNLDNINDDVIESMIRRFNNREITIYKLAEEYDLNKSIISNLFKSHNVNPNISFDIHVFDIIDTEEKAYWLGFLYADGCIMDNNAFCLDLQPFDIEHLVKFSTFCHGKWLPRLYDDRCRFSLSNLYFKEQLIKLGCVPRKSLILKYPNTQIFSNSIFEKDFLRGYFDGDGCLSYCYSDYKRNRSKVTISCDFLGTIEFINSAQEFLSKHSIKGCVCRNNHSENNTFVIGFSKNNSIKLCDLLYSDASIYLNRKYARYKYFKDNNFAVLKSDLLDNDRVISEKAKEYIKANSEITIVNKSTIAL